MLASHGSRLQKAQNTKKIIKKRKECKNPSCVFAKYEKDCSASFYSCCFP
jgi:hypothetical protein